MTETTPFISVIIPTYNRLASLQRTLDALCVQTYPPQHMEVLVVTDGCTDDTVEMLSRYQAPFALRCIQQANQGPGEARNRGAALARGRWLLFLDDDVEPTPSLVKAHADAHRRQPGHVVVGPYPPAMGEQSFLHIHVRSWWDRLFEILLRPGHRFSYDHLLSGNVSIETELFARIGGFDPLLRVHEDYELGMRLIKAGVPLTTAGDALGYHHELIDLRRSCVRKRHEGRADVHLARRHPELKSVLRMSRHESPGGLTHRIVRFLAFGWTIPGETLLTCLRVALRVLERTRLRSAWRCVLGVVHDYWYWRGVVDELGSRRELARFLYHDQPSIEKGLMIEIDLRDGVPAAERRLEEERPAGVRVRYGRRPIGIISPRPGAELLRGAHIRPMLVNGLAVPFLQALALEGGIMAASTEERQKLSQSIRSAWDWFGPAKPSQIWCEQYGQWKRLKNEESAEEQAVRAHWDRYRELAYETAWLDEQRKELQKWAEKRI